MITREHAITIIGGVIDSLSDGHGRYPIPELADVLAYLKEEPPLDLMATIRDALDYAAEDFAERANIEAKHRPDDGDPEEGSEEAEYIATANRFSAALEALDRRRTGSGEQDDISGVITT